MCYSQQLHRAGVVIILTLQIGREAFRVVHGAVRVPAGRACTRPEPSEAVPVVWVKSAPHDSWTREEGRQRAVEGVLPGEEGTELGLGNEEASTRGTRLATGEGLG